MNENIKKSENLKMIVNVNRPPQEYRKEQQNVRKQKIKQQQIVIKQKTENKK